MPTFDPIDTVKNQLLFTESSQFRRWHFKPQILAQLRVSTTINAIEAASLLWISEPDFKVPTELVTWQCQRDLVSFFQGKIIDYCTSFGFDKTVQGTAIAYFGRFFLKHSVLEHDYKVVLMTALFLATKVENINMSLADFLAKIPKAPSTLVLTEMEKTLCQALDFDLKVHLPYWPLHGLFLDIQSHLSSSVNFTETVKELFVAYTRAIELLTRVLCSDLPLLYLPSQLAFAALLESTPEFGLTGVMESYIQSRFDGEEVDVFIKSMEIIKVQMSNVEPVEKSVAANAANLVRACFNPEFDPTKKS